MVQIPWKPPRGIFCITNWIVSLLLSLTSINESLSPVKISRGWCTEYFICDYICGENYTLCCWNKAMDLQKFNNWPSTQRRFYAYLTIVQYLECFKHDCRLALVSHEFDCHMRLIQFSIFSSSRLQLLTDSGLARTLYWLFSLCI